MDGAKTTTILKSDALGRVTVTKDKREAVLDEFERSGLKGAEFARMAGIRYQTFAYWVQQRKHSRGQYQRKAAEHSVETPGVRLLEAVVTQAPADKPVKPGPAALTAETTLEVLLPGGARLLVANADQIPLVAKLIKSLARSC